LFLKEKCDSIIKARECAHGRSQREYMTKSDNSSPMVSLEAMLLPCAMDTKEGRYLAVTNILGTFIQADM